METKKIALFHPWIKSRGGAEKTVLEILKKSKHKIDLYTWIYEPEKTFPEFKKYNIQVIAPKIAEKFSRLNVLRGFLLPLGILKKIPLENYDLLLISTSGMGEFITFRNFKENKTLAYIHTPLRESDKRIIKWNLDNKYDGKFLKKSFYLLATRIYSRLEKKAWKRLDVVIFNSELTRKRAEERDLIGKKKNYVVNPPVKLEEFGKLKSKKSKEKYFLYVSRINPPKRQDILIEAWKEFIGKFPEYHLIIAGTPENKGYFKKIQQAAGETKNIEIKTEVSDFELKELVRGCEAGIFLGYQEDFGITPLEIISAKKPLIAVDEGGYVDLIRKHPNFYKLKEKHSQEEMIKEVYLGLERFALHRISKNPKDIKIKSKDFAKEIDKIIEEI